MENGCISIYIDEINMHQKLRLRDDSRLDGVLFFEDEMMMVAHIKMQNGLEEEVKKEEDKK